MARTRGTEKGFPQNPVLALRARELLSDLRQLVAAEQWRDAAPKSAALVQTAPDLAEAHDLMGTVAMRTGALPIAESCFERAVAIGPATGTRLLNWGKALQALGEAAAAEKVLHRALLIRPEDPALLGPLGDAQLSQGREDEALRSFRRILKKHPDDAYAAHMVSALTQSGTPDKTYVTRLFDDYADIFDAHLTGALNYRVPEALAAMVQRQRPSFGTALDIGCGTGLVATALQGATRQIDGVDIAPNMIEKARSRSLYRHLAAGDATEVMATDPAFAGPYDLVLAADVFIYIGAIEELFTAITTRLAPGGILAFSIEASGGKDIEIRASGRFAHSPSYIERLSVSLGFALLETADHVIRLENNQPIPGALYVLGRQ
jgi:predicted TPR repeat methyltransferase